MITTKDLLNSLKLQDTCPKCGANWVEVEKNLHTYDENYAIALAIILNCPVCKLRFPRGGNHGIY